ncbi:hypothetical protein IFU01_18260 [Oxalobacteraceae sp. CFBP 8763]|nr:hypothetical protein [Oxalobacteraceae sp. CFBP 8763]
MERLPFMIGVWGLGSVLLRHANAAISIRRISAEATETQHQAGLSAAGTSSDWQIKPSPSARCHFPQWQPTVFSIAKGKAMEVV